MFPSEFLARLSVEKRTEFWRRGLSESRSMVLVAEREGCVAGWVSGGTSRDSDAQGAAEVYAVHVEPDLWRHGIGQQLMITIEECFPVLTDVTLWVLHHNQRAIGFYRKIGYEFDGGQKTDQLADVAIAEVRLRKKRASERSYAFDQ